MTIEIRQLGVTEWEIETKRMGDRDKEREV
jgi:hypothetical protein